MTFFPLFVFADKPHSLVHFKSADLAEQITLLDGHHFWKLESAELLIWVKEQNEEKSPNLVRFTKHFNAMSYWCRWAFGNASRTMHWPSCATLIGVS